MKCVIIESPFAGGTLSEETITGYLYECLSDSLNRNEAPFASHAIYPLVLNDEIKEERMKGIVCGFQWMARCDLVAVYTDLGISEGMKLGIQRAADLGKPIEYRSLRETVHSPR